MFPYRKHQKQKANGKKTDNKTIAIFMHVKQKRLN